MFHYPQPQFTAIHRPATSNFFIPIQPFVYRPNGPILNHSTHQLNFPPDFERFSAPPHGFPTMPSAGHPFFDYTNQNFDPTRWRTNLPRTQQQHRRTPAFHFQDKSTSYFMTDPIITSDDRITIHLTKVHIGPNGDQQRVFVEQEFSNEQELNAFVRNLRQNFEKTFNNGSSAGNSPTEESTSTDSKKSGVVVVEEPDEEPKIYQQQAYNANIESKKAAAASHPTPSSSPAIESTIPSKSRQNSPTPTIEYQPKKQTPPPSSSQTRASRIPKNKTKYRRQHNDTRDEMKSSRVFHTPGASRPYQATPIPNRFHQRFSHPNTEFHLPPNSNFQWRNNPNGFPKNRSRSYVPPMNTNFPHPPTPAHFRNPPDPFVRPINTPRFTPHHPEEFRPSAPSPSKFRRSHRRKNFHQPNTITENHIYPNHGQQQPRVHRTKSECQNLIKDQQHRSRSTTNQFPVFSPLQRAPPMIQRHFVHFRSPPVILSSVHSTAPLFYPNRSRQFANIPSQLRLINPFHLGTNRF